MWLPFLYLGIGIVIGIAKISMVSRIFDVVSQMALVILMMVIGANIGIDQTLMSQVGWIGMNCLLLAFFAIFFSVAFSVLLEKTIVPLEQLKETLFREKISVANEIQLPVEIQEKKKISFFMLGIPAYLLGGVLIGIFLIPEKNAFILNYLMNAALMIIYLGVGISLGSDMSVFRYLKILGLRVLLFPCAIFMGSVFGAFLVGFFLNIPLVVSVTAVSGMSYYSVTGAYMTEVLGSEAGIYGFVVNVMREFLTVLFLPILVRIGKSAPMAGGASGNMDTMLLPITRFVGPELGLVALIVGTTLTLIVPFLLPFVVWVIQ